MFVYENSTHGGLSYEILEDLPFSQKHGANPPPKMVKGRLSLKKMEIHHHHHHSSPRLTKSYHHTTCHHISPRMSPHLPPHPTTPHNISMIAPEIKWETHPTQLPLPTIHVAEDHQKKITVQVKCSFTKRNSVDTRNQHHTTKGNM